MGCSSLLLLLSFLHKTLFSDTWRKYHSISTKGADGKEVIFLVKNPLLCHPAGQFAIGKHIVLYYTFCPKSVPSRSFVHGDKIGRIGASMPSLSRAA